MSDPATLYAQGREFLDSSSPLECIGLLTPLLGQQNEAQPEYLAVYQLLGEAFLEAGDPQNAYELFSTCAQLDADGLQGGIEKFLWLGQLTGGRDGEVWYEKGIKGLKTEINNLTSSNNNTSSIEEELKLKKVKLCEALCGMVEIWMTDLCMEPEAEARCEALITESLMVNDTHPESWSVLGSIRISQQRNDDARSALQKSWDLYHAQIAATESDLDYAQLLPALIRLAQNMFEMQQLEQTVQVTAEINRLDDEIPEPYYLHGLARFELYKQLRAQNLPRKAARQVAGAREAWEHLLKLAQMDGENLDPELVPTVTEHLKELPQVTQDDYTSSEEEIDDLELDDVENLQG
ncbi:hypothetical protein D0Z00_001362 [Geotrichum galactomycetum]|uniref:Uncharacterized protein n=1 Tax=Geotrichum galactomycetum TaxID=27317 RepID=A0ACB6V713_9ASCO|nr:hypothetical protein D0Z00_001362 [Geotrichum candidum]